MNIFFYSRENFTITLFIFHRFAQSKMTSIFLVTLIENYRHFSLSESVKICLILESPLTLLHALSPLIVRGLRDTFRLKDKKKSFDYEYLSHFCILNIMRRYSLYVKNGFRGFHRMSTSSVVVVVVVVVYKRGKI